jgi:hypothetical protein
MIMAEKPNFTVIGKHDKELEIYSDCWKEQLIETVEEYNSEIQYKVESGKIVDERPMNNIKSKMAGEHGIYVERMDLSIYLWERTKYERDIKDWEETYAEWKDMNQLGLLTMEPPISFEERPKPGEEDKWVDIIVEEEIEWDLDDLIGPEPKFEENKWEEALLKARKPGGKGLSTCAQISEDLEGKLYDKLKKVKENDKPRLRKHGVTLADLELGVYCENKYKYQKDK